MRATPADGDARPQRPERLAARLRRRAVDHQDAVEVIELVLHGPRRVSLEVERDVVPPLVLALDANAEIALDGREHALERQAALVLQLDLLAATSDHRVHERPDLVVLG